MLRQNSFPDREKILELKNELRLCQILSQHSYLGLPIIMCTAEPVLVGEVSAGRKEI